jgi:hypothetical protein
VWKFAPVFVPWMYVLLALVIGGLAVATRHREALALCLSGLAMEATLFFLAPSHDYRYSHWLVVATCLAAVLAGVRRAQLGSRRAAVAEAVTGGTSTGTSTGGDTETAAPKPNLQPTT